jgi:hypothetical protein
MFRFGLALAAISVALPAAAANKKASRLAVASTVVQRTGEQMFAETVAMKNAVREGILPKRSMALASDAVARASLEALVSHMEPEAKQAKSQIDYKGLLGKFVITRDVQIPGAPTMMLRFIPHSGPGTNGAPIVFTPRIVGSSWYGLDFAAHF